MTKFFIRITFIFFFSLVTWNLLESQELTGNLNYTQTSITAINVNNAEVTVPNTTGFAIADRVLIIQMQGAVINTTNTSAFGDVQDYNGAGSYEIATVCSVSDNQLVFENELLNTYDPAGVIQVIKIPQYTNLNITGILTASAWNGSQGGVLVLEAESITLSGDIDMNEKGFRGAAMENSTLNCTFINIFSGYFYDNPGNGAPKGEGISVLASSMAYGRGAAANGGGGGNDHNSGGGGGGNIGSGGPGGTNGETALFNCKGDYPGEGGKGLSSSNRIFPGGGGGAGHGNNNEATSGGNGGGIIILIAQSMTGNGVTISANGQTALNTSYGVGDLGGDGAGAGGAGGSVHLDIPSITGTITVETIGGNGGDVVHTGGANRCFGPGGGGAGGVVKFKGTASGSVTTVLTAGINGTNQVIGTTSSCLGSAQGSTPGLVGTVYENIAEVPTSTTNFADCSVLPVEVLAFLADRQKDKVELSWTTLSETNNNYFSLERSQNGIQFDQVSKIQGAGTTSERNEYSYTDNHPLTGQGYYRLAMVDYNGNKSYSKIQSVTFYNGPGRINIYPNPAQVGEDIFFSIDSKHSGTIGFQIFDMLGKMQYSGSEKIEKGENLLRLPIENSLGRTFIIKFKSGTYITTRKFVLLD
jgi:hypothetical protein